MPQVDGKYKPNIGAPRTAAREEPAAERAKDFRPVDTGFTKEDAIAEARNVDGAPGARANHTRRNGECLAARAAPIRRGRREHFSSLQRMATFECSAWAASPDVRRCL